VPRAARDPGAKSKSRPSPDGPRILLYHRVALDPLDHNQLCVRPEHFAAQLAVLARSRTVVPLGMLLAESAAETVDQSMVSITFDDGYRDVFDTALPMLADHGFHATAFVSGPALAGRRPWWDCLAHGFRTKHDGTEGFDAMQAVGRDLVLAREAAELVDQFVDPTAPWPPGYAPIASVAELRDAWSQYWKQLGLAPHGSSHVMLSRLSPRLLRDDIAQSCQYVFDISGETPRYFAYPFGTPPAISNAVIACLRRNGIRAAFTTDQRPIAPAVDPFRVPRMLVRDWDGDEFEAWLQIADPAPFLDRATSYTRDRFTRPLPDTGIQA
jgi:peptidoglycan/xylan/chitin deacetylase (PgdA/CDA1 family)